MLLFDPFRVCDGDCEHLVLMVVIIVLFPSTALL